jgi:hypothetical protein
MGKRKTPTKGWRITQLDWTRYDSRNRAIHQPVSDPSWEQILSAIKSLDGGRQSDMVFEAANGNMMCIGGGCGRFVVCTQTGRDSSTGVAANLINPSGVDEVREGVVVGGCQSDITERYIVDLPITLKAAEKFFLTGELEPTLVWEPY